MNSMDSHEAIENDNLNLFPKSFAFFDYVMSHQPIFIYFSNTILFFSLIQQYFSLLLPLLTPLFTSNGNQSFFRFFSISSSKNDSVFVNFVLILVQYTSNIPSFLTYESSMISYFLPSFLVILFVLFIISLFYQNDEIPSFICQIRCLLFLFVPSLSILPIAIRLSFALKSFFYDEEVNDTIITYEIILGIVFLAILAVFTSWSSPMISQSPICGKGQIPSHLIPDSSFITKTQLVDIINVCASIIGNNDISIFVFLIVAFINSIYKVNYIINYPYLSIFHSAAVCSISFSSSLCLIIFFFQIFFNKFSEAILLLASIILLLAFLIIFYYFLLFLEKKKVSVITSKNYDQIKMSLIPAYFQSAIINGILSPELVDFSLSNHPHPNSPQFLIGMLISEKIGLKPISEMISAILNADGLTFSQKYFVYLIYTKYIRSCEKKIEFRGLKDIENRLDVYNKNSDDFWSLMLIGKTNKALKIVSNNESKLTRLLRNYNLYYQASPHNQHVSELHQQFFYNFVKTPVNSDIQIRSKNASQESIMSSVSVMPHQNMQISYNLKKALDQHIPLFLILIRIIGFLCFLIFITASMFPIFQLSSDSSILLNLNPALNHSLNIALLFSKMNLAVANVINCSYSPSLYCADILKFLNSTSNDPVTIRANLIKYADLLIARLNAMTNQFSNLVQNQYLTELTNLWNEPSISLFPDSDINSTKSIKIDINSALLLFASQIKENTPLDSFFSADSLRPNTNEIYNRSSQVQIGINNSFYHYNDYTKALIGSGAKFFNSTETVIMVIFGLASIAIPCLCSILSEKRSYIILNKYFRPSSHPNPQFDHIKASNTVEPFKTSHSYHSKLFVWVFVIVVTFLAALLFSSHLSPAYEVMMNESQMLICLERLSTYVSLITETLMRNLHFPNDKSVVDLFYSLKEDKYASMTEFYNSMSPELIQHFRKNTLNPITKNRCEITSRSSKDVYNCWNFIQQCEFYLFLFHTHNLSEITDDISYHISHMYMNHISNGLIQIGDMFTKYSLQTRESFLAILIFGLIVYFLIVITTFSITLSETYKILHLQRQISRFFMVLPPVYVAQNSCLMDYVIDKEEKVTKKVADSYFSLYENTEIALIVINDRLSITSFTQAVLHLFSYRAEQLIGQQIDLLFPKEIESNDIQFFQHISIVKKRQAENTFTRTLIGVVSYGEKVQFNVKVTAFDKNESDEDNDNVYFVLECQSEQARCEYDELIQKHIDFFNDIYQLSEPIWLFNNMSQTTDSVLLQHFTRFAMVCVFSQPDDDTDNFISHLITTLPYFSGIGGEIIYYYTDVSCLAFFVDANTDYLFNAYQFFVSFGKNCCGFIVEGIDIDLAFFPLPQIPEEYTINEMPGEVAQQYQSSMTVEPMTKLMKNIPDLTKMCRHNELICTEGILGFCQNSNYKLVDNAMDMTLFMVDMKY